MVGMTEGDYGKIVAWMIHVLDRLGIDHRDERPCYDNRSMYDHAFYQVTHAARDFWGPRLGYVPTDEALFRAFFEAEKQRLRAARPDPLAKERTSSQTSSTFRRLLRSWMG